MLNLSKSKREQTENLLVDLYDRLEGHIDGLVVTGWPARDHRDDKRACESR